jgi:ABC-type transporter MlaC component
VYYADDFVGSGVKIRSSHKNGKFVLVDSAVSMSKGGNTKLRWRLRAGGNYKKIADINFRGIWLSIRLRDDIASVLKRNKGDFAALIAHLDANS